MAESPRPQLTKLSAPAPLGVARARHIRGSTRKLRDVAALVRQQSVLQAFALLAASNKRAAGTLTKVIKSASSNALQQHPQLTLQGLHVGKVLVDEGPMWKRFRAVAMGRATTIRKRTSHITVTVTTREQMRPAAHGA